jgi:exopolyphosphatase/guanosine-5'-triphosphate,3'-diphosphate pyrophosphatase
MLAFYGLPDPLTDEQAAGLRSYIRSELGELMAALRPLGPQLLIGASGTFETLAELVAHRRPARPIPEHFNGYEFTAAEFQEVLQALMQSTHQARLQMRGLATERVDMIVMGALLVEYVLTQTGIERIRVSESALKEGVIYTYGHTTVSEPG